MRLSPAFQELMTQDCLGREGWVSPESAKKGERFLEEAPPVQLFLWEFFNNLIGV